MQHTGDSEVMIKRLSLGRIVEHHVNAITFFLLAATGLAQRFHTAGWARWTVDAMGGIDRLRLVHRWAGLLFVTLLVVHLATALYLVMVRRVQPSMLINGKDFTDAVHNLRYYFGLTRKPAQCDRFDYKQKFEYWGVVMGGILMGTTGLMLWFPVQLYQLLPFSPGQLIPAAKVAHSNEAMLAFMVIVLWHMYNSVFSPEVFPLDTTVFTGYISRSRMRHEHPVELDRMIQQGLVPAAEHDEHSHQGHGDSTQGLRAVASPPRDDSNPGASQRAKGA